jgi:hypothetical protein
VFPLSAQLLAQAVASFGASSGIAGSGSGNVVGDHHASSFLAASSLRSHHG